MKISTLIIFSLFLFTNRESFAQAPQASIENNFTLQQCIDYAVQNHNSIKTASLDVEIAKAKTGEIRAAGLPQANIDGMLLHNMKVQSMFAPASALDKNAPSNIIVPLGFGVPYSSNATLGISQLLFSGSYLVGLQAAKTYVELANSSITITKASLIQNVTKAYYLTLINEERKQLFAANLNRLDTLLKQTKALQQAGFAETIDVSRLEVTYNNLLTEKQKFDNLFDLSSILLKYQMGMPITEQLKLTDKIGTFKTLAIATNAQAQFSNRPEYGLLQAQKKLYELDLKSNRAGYLPTLAAFGNLGYNSGNFTVSQLYSEKWYPYSNLGLALNVPIFDGFQKVYKSQQSKLNIEKTNQSISTLENTINLQVKVAEINLKNSTQSLENQQHNIKLAEEVAKGSEYKYKMGVGANLEVVTAESALKEAQINYYNALYDVLVYKVDMDFALGNLK